jgi:hypothetical protein
MVACSIKFTSLSKPMSAARDHSSRQDITQAIRQAAGQGAGHASPSAWPLAGEHAAGGGIVQNVAQAVGPFRVLVAPGLHNSGPDHWQSRWQHLFPAFERVEQDDWEAPDLARWSARVDELRQSGRSGRSSGSSQLSQSGGGADDTRPLLIIAHSFGCLATAHSVARDPSGVAGVLLVAPADPDKFNVAAQLPQQALPCPSIMIGSTNDPWMAAPRAAQWAQRWNSHFVDGGALGHINTESGLGDWPHGLEMLYLLIDMAQNRARAIQP